MQIDIDLKEIETINLPSGKPVFQLSENVKNKIQALFNIEAFKIHLSLSHTISTAIAFIIIEST